MVAVILERCNKSLKECFGINNVCEIPFFDTTLKHFLKDKNIFKEFEKIFEISEKSNDSKYLSEVNKLKIYLEKHPCENVVFTYSDVYIGEYDFLDFIETKNNNFCLINSEKERFLCVLKSTDFLKILLENEDDLRNVFKYVKEEKVYNGYVKIIDNPLKYKAFCCDTLSGKVSYRLPEVAQGIYASSSIPEGDFVLIPPVYFGDDVQIEKGCVIGPYTVISDGGLIAQNSHVRNSFLGENTYISSGCHAEGSVLSQNVVLRRNSVVFDSCVLCHDVTIGEDSVVEKDSFIRAFSRVDELSSSLVNYKMDETHSNDGFYGYSPEKAALLGAATGLCFDMPKIAVASDGELNSTALKLAFLGGLMTTGASCYDFGNTFFSSLHYYMNFCELDCAAFISGNDEGTVISLFKNGETALSKSDFYNIKSVLFSADIPRCGKEECKNVRQIHGMQRMYIQNLTNLFDESIDFMPVFYCDNKRILSVAELAVSKIGFKTGKNRVVFNINPWGTKVSAQSDGIVYPYSKLLEIVSFFQRKTGLENFNDIYKIDSVLLSFYIIKILVEEKLSLKEVVEGLPRFYVAEKNIENSCRLKILAADLSQENKVEFRKDEIYFNDGLSSVKINENQKGGISIKAKAHSMETATEIVENLTRFISERGLYNY